MFKLLLGTKIVRSCSEELNNLLLGDPLPLYFSTIADALDRRKYIYCKLLDFQGRLTCRID